jgi:hypothetical protein
MSNDTGDDFPNTGYFKVTFGRDKKKCQLFVGVEQEYGVITTEREQQLWHGITELLRT